MRLISEWSRIEHALGYALKDNFLMPVRTLDNPKAFTPLILEKEDRRWVIVQGIEQGNVESLSLPPDIVPVYVQPYFTFEDVARPPIMAKTVIEAVRSVAGNATTMTIDPHLPISLEAQLSHGFDLGLENEPDIDAVRVRTVECRVIASRLDAGRPEAGSAALRLLDRNPRRDRLAAYLEPAEMSRRHFASLDAVLAEAGMSGVVVTSRINVQEIGGVPVGAHRRPLAVIYASGEGVAHIIERAGGSEGKRFSSLLEAADALLPRGVIGVESEDMGAGVFRALGLRDSDSSPADVALRRWRDGLAASDLPYYIIAARTSARSIEAALDFAAAAVADNQSITEKDVDRVYFNGLHEQLRATGLPLRVTRYMTNLHCGTRTPFPANPTAFPVTKDVRTLKIDSGCLIYDHEGYLCGVSDIARTLCFTPEAREIYPLIVDGVRRTLIPSVKAGVVAEDVFEAGVNAIWNRREELSSSLLTPDLPSLGDVYRRDVGHLLGKNDLAHLRFIRGDKGVLAEGMVACLEYQWPIDGHALAYEDTCLITGQGGLNFTSDED